MVNNGIVTKCREASLRVRRSIIEMTYAAGRAGAHLGGSLSMVELLVGLYLGCIRFDAMNPNWEGRDRVILSKGHGALALYPTLAEAGIIDKAELATFKQDGSRLWGHPSLNGLPGIEFASGSLGQGLSLGVGTCLGLQLKNNNKSCVYVFLGDGECDEGSVWEAAASASHFGLSRIVAVIDVNNIQYDGFTTDVLDLGSLVDKWAAFGWKTISINGNDVEEVLGAYSLPKDEPLAILAHTIKGRGISFMENDWKYHNASLSKKQYCQAIGELEVAE